MPAFAVRNRHASREQKLPQQPSFLTFWCIFFHLFFGEVNYKRRDGTRPSARPFDISSLFFDRPVLSEG